MISSKANSSLYFLIIFIGFLLPANFSYSQTNKKIRDLFNGAYGEMYSNPDKAIKIGEQIVNLSEKDVPNKIRAYLLISDAFTTKRNYNKSLEYTLKANQLLPLTNDTISKIFVLSKAGTQYHLLKMDGEAMHKLDESEQLMLVFSNKNLIHYSLGVNYLAKGFIYKDKRANDIAINFFDKGVAELLKEKNTPFNNNPISIAKYNKGNCFIALKNNAQAIKNFNEAFEYAKITGAKNLQAFALKGKAQVYTSETNYSLAIETLNEALFYASESKDLILLIEIYSGFSENYMAVNNLVEFKKFYLKYLKVKNEINVRERNSLSNSLKEKTKDLKENLEKKTNNFYLAYSILALLLILLIFISLNQIKKNRKKIEIKKKEIQLLLSQNENNQT